MVALPSKRGETGNGADIAGTGDQYYFGNALARGTWNDRQLRNIGETATA
jgi:hypothetical protein